MSYMTRVHRKKKKKKKKESERSVSEVEKSTVCRGKVIAYHRAGPQNTRKTSEHVTTKLFAVCVK